MTNAIEVSDLYVSYKGLKKISIKQSIAKFKFNQTEIFEALKGVSFNVEEGKILGIIGKNGSGKSTLLRAISGIFSPDKGNVNLNGNLHVYGSLDVSGQKNRVVQTKNHGKRLMNAVESADAFFEDFGTAMTDVEGFCEVKLDEIFLETVNTHCTYYIQLTAYKDGNVCIFEKGENSFKVKGTTNTQFDWRISAKQKGYEDIRMEVMKK